MLLLKYSVGLICLLLFTLDANAQFLGGIGDGYNLGETGQLSINPQVFYCLGGDTDGYTKNSVAESINIQNLSCKGGIGDGFEMESTGQVVQFEQAIYCRGGDAGGYNYGTSGVVPTADQSYYCTGGNGDGYDFETSGSIVQFDQSFYCAGGEGDGYKMKNLLSTVNEQSFYCLSSEGDGYFMKSTGIIAPNDASFYCSGGTADGYGNFNLNSSVNTQTLYSLGGEGDGFQFESYNGTIYGINLFCLGGTGDGYHFELLCTTPNQQNIYCSGGNTDGYHLSLYSGNIFGSNLFCLGGDGDGYNRGFSTPSIMGIGIWTGITSSEWNTSGNWTHNTIPNFTIDATIPASCPNYPLVSQTIGISTKLSSVKCKSLTILDGAIMTHTSSIRIYGKMNVHGTYISDVNAVLQSRIYSGGFLTITGTYKVGNQSSGTGVSDMRIYSGGKLHIDGGTLQIDDQFLVATGGSFHMTGGEMWIHKYGEGSTYSSSYPGSFVIFSGANGYISDGTIKVCGKESVDEYHAFSVMEPAFAFSGNSTIQFEHGLFATHYNPSIYTADDVSLQNLTINKPGNTVFVKSDLNVKGELKVQYGSSLEVESGHQVFVGQ